ncbi:MAG: pyridoxal phosphate-dependent aminotransferase family protein, partial [bacterium]|nr:pyridoxal phosphate-dependent aminotransferase family protein [bacterium]
MTYIMESELGAQTIINQNLVDYFGGCSYFGFQVHPEVIRAACDAALRYGISSATSTAGYGNNPVLIDLEEKVSQFFGTQDVVHYASGCLGNFILVVGLKEDFDVIFVDKESHYTIKSAMSIVDKPQFEFEHMDAEDLSRKLKQHLKPSQRPLVLCDGIFPVSGELSPTPQYAEVMKDIEGAMICVDDAHATGVIGKKGYGSFEYFGLQGKGRYSAGVFSKALGGHGGLIVGEKDFIAKLKTNSPLANACSTTPIPAAAATSKALEILHNNPKMRENLWENTFYAKKGLRDIGFDIDDTPVPIICLSDSNHSNKNMDCQKLQKELFEKNIAVTYIPGGGYTSVPKNGAIRISIFCSHEK